MPSKQETTDDTGKFTTWLTVLPIFAGFAYSIVRVAYDAFYEQWGIDSNEVGFDQVAATGRVGVALIFAAVIAMSIVFVGEALLVSPIFVLMERVTSEPLDHLLSRQRDLVKKNLPLGLSAGIIWGIAFLFQFQMRQSLLPTYMLDILLPSSSDISALIDWLGKSPVPLLIGFSIGTTAGLALVFKALRGQAPFFWLAVCWLSIGLGGAVTLASAYQIGDNTAKQFSRSHFLHPVPLISWFAPPIHCVHAEWIGQLSNNQTTRVSDHGIYYLGATGNISVFYDPIYHEPLRLPSRSVLMIGKDIDDCYPPPPH